MMENISATQMGIDFLVGPNSTPIYIATMLLDIFKDYLAVFLAIIIGIMGYQKLKGEQWRSVLTSGIGTMITFLGAIYLTDSNNKISISGEDRNMYMLVQAERNIIKMGSNISNELLGTMLFGKPEKTKNTDGTTKVTFNPNGTGYLLEKIESAINAQLNADLESVEKINNNNNNLLSTRENIFKEVDKILMRFGQGYFQYFNYDEIMDIRLKQTNGFRNLSNQEFFKARLDAAVKDDIIYEANKIVENSPNKFYYPSFLAEFSKISSLSSAWKNTVKYDVTSKNKYLDGVLNDLFMSLFSYSFDLSSEDFIYPTMSYEASANKTDKEKAAEKELNDLDTIKKMKIDKVSSVTLHNKANELIKFTMQEIIATYKDENQMKKALRDFRTIVSFFIKFQGDIKNVNASCGTTVVTLPNKQDIVYPKKSQKAICQKSMVEMVNNINYQLSGRSGDFNKTALTSRQNENELADLQKLFMKSPVAYSLNCLKDIIKLKSLNKVIELNTPVSTVTYDTVEDQIKASNDNTLISEKIETNRKIISNEYGKIKEDIIRVFNKNVAFKDTLIKTAVVDIEKKNKEYEYVSKKFNKFEYSKSIREDFMDEQNNPIGWMSIGFHFGKFVDISQPFVLMSMKKIDTKETIMEKMNEVERLVDTYSNQAIIRKAKETTQVLAGIEAFGDVVEDLFSGGGKNILSGTSKALMGTVTLVGSAAYIAYKAVEVQVYVEAVGAIIVAIKYVLPSLIWLIAIFTWIYKTAIIIAILPLATFMLSFVNFDQVKSAFFTLVHLMLTPVVLVVMFFISVELASFLPIFIDKMFPWNVGEILQLSAPINPFNNYVKETIEMVDKYMSEDGVFGMTVDIFYIIKMVIAAFFELLILVAAFLKTDEYLGMAIGSGSVSLSDGNSLQNKALSAFKMI